MNTTSEKEQLTTSHKSAQANKQCQKCGEEPQRAQAQSAPQTKKPMPSTRDSTGKVEVAPLALQSARPTAINGGAVQESRASAKVST